MKTTQEEKQGLTLAKKLYALAQQGIGGEKENAEEMLERIMKKIILKKIKMNLMNWISILFINHFTRSPYTQ